MGSLAGLTFAAPYVLLALIALPAIYFLLRVTPPSPKRVVFPPLRLLFGLQAKEETPARTPWWLLLLRLFAAALVILALAEPVFNAAPSALGKGPLLIVVDNGWPAAPQWNKRLAAINTALTGAARDKRQVALLATADTITAPLRLQDADTSANAASEIAVRSWVPDRMNALKRLSAWKASNTDILWLSDGLEHGRAQDFATALDKIGALTIIADPENERALALRPPSNGNTGFDLTLLRSNAGDARQGRVAALDSRGRILESADYRFASGERESTATIVLPLELRNDTARVAVLGHASAGAVQLTDARYRRRPVGLVSGGSADLQQPLLSDIFYIERALQPFAEVRKGTIGQVLDSHVAVLMLADIGQMTSEESQAVARFIAEGGVLVRFAGPRLAANADEFTPVKLRSGERLMGSAMAWPEPQHIAPFPDNSPFNDLVIPEDVTVSRQVLAEPSVELSERGWARLVDGTPLVTAEARGQGWLVLFHVGASPGWSSLPLSGLYVDMLRRVVDLSEGVSTVFDRASALLPPYRALDGFGQLQAPYPDSLPLKPGETEKTKVDAQHPPGLYGRADALLAFNAIGPRDVLAPLALQESVQSYQGDVTRALKFPLLTAALLLFLIDAIIALVLRGLLSAQTFRRAASALALFLVLMPEVHAANIDAALSTRLAFVMTGDGEVDQMSREGMFGLGLELSARTAYEPGDPIGVNVENDDLSFYPLLYWPMAASQTDLSPKATAKLDQFMRSGGTILFDTRDAPLAGLEGVSTPGETTLRRLLAKLDIPPLAPVPADHVLTKAFYLLQDFPGRWAGGQAWVEALPTADPNADPGATPARGGDGVSPVIIGGNDWASAWAKDLQGRPTAAVTPGGEDQREMAIRFGVNAVMYSMTGNYKTDQVHVPALLERLGQ